MFIEVVFTTGRIVMNFALMAERICFIAIVNVRIDTKGLVVVMVSLVFDIVLRMLLVVKNKT